MKTKYKIYATLIVLALIPLILVPVYAFVHPVSTIMLGRWITGKPVIRVWKPLDQISPNLVRAVIAGRCAWIAGSEDPALRATGYVEADLPAFARLRRGSP